MQRISAARIASEKENRRIQDGEVKTACQAVCPAEAIVFGDLNDPKSRVSQFAKNGRGYHVLAELNTVPRITYQTKIRSREEGANA